MEKIYQDSLSLLPTQTPSTSNTTLFTQALENGSVIYLPQLAFQLAAEENILLSPHWIAKKHKNISFNSTLQKLQGFTGGEDNKVLMQSMLKRFSERSTALINYCFPHYAKQLMIGRTSFRPAEIAGRPAPSYRKDDTRLHVDAFPASPNQGKRILRVFCNIHSEKPRVWRVGESFESVVKNFLPQVTSYSSLLAHLLRISRVTRSFRSRYDHTMLQIHNQMKKDMDYQNQAKAEVIEFAPQSTWIVFTDQVSHAALSGQHVLEQTFYLPVEAMALPEKSPLRILESYFFSNKKVNCYD